MNIELFIQETFSQYAYQPFMLYTIICLIMTASSFGLPIPEEFTLVTAGLIAYMGMHPDKYPPPEGAGDPVNLYTLATVCFVAVLASDILIYSLGRFFGQKIFKSQFFNKHIGMERVDKVNDWFQKYSIWVCGIFRFLPGIRFIGHLTCGALKIPTYIFIGIDGLAALISVPTQVLLVAFFGEVIISKMKEFKLAILCVILICTAIFFFKKWREKKATNAVS